MNYLGLGTYKEKTVLAQSSGGWTSTRHSVGSGKDHGLLLIFRSCLLCSTWTNHCLSSFRLPLQCLLPSWDSFSSVLIPSSCLKHQVQTLLTGLHLVHSPNLFVFWDFFYLYPCECVSRMCLCPRRPQEGMGPPEAEMNVRGCEPLVWIPGTWAVCALNHCLLSSPSSSRLSSQLVVFVIPCHVTITACEFKYLCYKCLVLLS